MEYKISFLKFDINFKGTLYQGTGPRHRLTKLICILCDKQYLKDKLFK